MRELFTRSVTAALSLILGAGALCSQAAPVTVAGGNSSTVAGWQISPDPEINLNITGANSTQTLVIQGESATFDNGGPLNVTFKQLSDDAVATTKFHGAKIDNATAQEWSGSTSSLTGWASFEGLSSVFGPPLGPAADYNMAFPCAPTIVKYSGTQLSGAVSTWKQIAGCDELLTASDPSEDGADDSAFILLSQTPVVGEVRAPLAVWQSLTGLVFVMFITSFRTPKPVSIG